MIKVLRKGGHILLLWSCLQDPSTYSAEIVVPEGYLVSIGTAYTHEVERAIAYPKSDDIFGPIGVYTDQMRAIYYHSIYEFGMLEA